MTFQDNFKQLLTDFFKIYHPRQVKKVDAIAAEFKGQEVEAFKHLCRKYKVAKAKITGLEEAEQLKLAAAKITPQIEAPVDEENTSAINSSNSATESSSAHEMIEEDEFNDEEETVDKKKKKKK